MHDLEKELHRTCERVTKELSELNDRLDQNKNMISPADIDLLFKMMDVIKNTKSTMKKIVEMEMMEENQNGYSGAYSGGMYYDNPMMWDRTSGARGGRSGEYSGEGRGGSSGYSGNSYRGSYTLESGNSGDYSGARGRGGRSRGYSRNSEKEAMRMELNDMLEDARDEKEAEAIRKIMARL